jgi:hypothetical protein
MKKLSINQMENMNGGTNWVACGFCLTGVALGFGYLPGLFELVSCIECYYSGTGE